MSVAPQDDQQAVSQLVVIDDDPHLRSLLADSLATFGNYEVTAVADGAAGLETVVALHPTCVVVDVLMPGLNGYQFLRALRGDPATQDIPVVILSALSQEEDELRGLLSGADAYLFKPVPLKELLAAVAHAIELTGAQRRERLRQISQEEEKQIHLSA